MQIEKPKQGYKLVKSLFGKYEEIPEDWDYGKLSDLAEKENDIVAGPFGSNLVVSDYRTEGIPIIRLQNIERNIFLNKNIQFISKEKAEELKYHSYQPDDLVLAKLGDPIGKTCRIPINFPAGIVVADVVRIRTSTNKCDSFFVEYVLNSEMCERQLNKERIGTTRPRVNLKQIRHLTFPTPPLKEQQKIASILSNIDSLIQLTQKEIEQTRRLKKGLMQRLLTKGIGHTRFKMEELGRKFLRYEIPEKWNVSKINDFATVNGRIGWKNLRADEYTNDGPLMLSVWSLVDTVPYGVDYREGVNRLSEFRYEESPEIKLQISDVLVAKDGDIGRIGFVKKLPESTTVNSHVVVVRVLDKSVNPEFLYWYMNAKPFQTYCVAFTSGTTVPLLTQKDLRNTNIPIPPINEQEKISLILSNNSSKIHSLQQRKSKLETLKNGLMQKLLTGQIRVKL